MKKYQRDIMNWLDGPEDLKLGFRRRRDRVVLHFNRIKEAVVCPHFSRDSIPAEGLVHEFTRRHPNGEDVTPLTVRGIPVFGCTIRDGAILGTVLDVEIHTLDPSHPLRNRPVAGMRFRAWAWHGGDLTVPPQDRGPDWQTRKWSKWRTVAPSWKIAQRTFNELGPAWTENKQWQFKPEIPAL